ncbi:hypothetical protein BC829DRAFT_401718 [Chytridium lagenaria]|nr:hypothetical protein BC829DRAFT_401718 [Chytridium lagenaria]
MLAEKVKRQHTKIVKTAALLDQTRIEREEAIVVARKEFLVKKREALVAIHDKGVVVHGEAVVKMGGALRTGKPFQSATDEILRHPPSASRLKTHHKEPSPNSTLSLARNLMQTFKQPQDIDTESVDVDTYSHHRRRRLFRGQEYRRQAHMIQLERSALTTPLIPMSRRYDTPTPPKKKRTSSTPKPLIKSPRQPTDVKQIMQLNKDKFKDVHAKIRSKVPPASFKDHLGALKAMRSRCVSERRDRNRNKHSPPSAAVLAVFQTENSFKDFKARYQRPFTAERRDDVVCYVFFFPFLYVFVFVLLLCKRLLSISLVRITSLCFRHFPSLCLSQANCNEHH